MTVDAPRRKIFLTRVKGVTLSSDGTLVVDVNKYKPLNKKFLQSELHKNSVGLSHNRRFLFVDTHKYKHLHKLLLGDDDDDDEYETVIDEQGNVIVVPKPHHHHDLRSSDNDDDDDEYETVIDEQGNVIVVPKPHHHRGLKSSANDDGDDDDDDDDDEYETVIDEQGNVIVVPKPHHHKHVNNPGKVNFNNLNLYHNTKSVSDGLNEETFVQHKSSCGETDKVLPGDEGISDTINEKRPVTGDNGDDSSSEDHETVRVIKSKKKYRGEVQEKIDKGELNKDLLDSLELQVLINGCRVPLGQEEIIEAIPDEVEDTRTNRIMKYMRRPARVQVKEYEASSYIQGNENYNIWYNKWSGENTNNDYVNGRSSLTPAMYKCDPDKDTGYTRGSNRHSIDECGTKYICLFFAKGCCSQGEKCLYLHRIPIIEDEYYLDSGVDIFGRERHAKHRDDMSGVGSFMSECKSLFVGDIRPDNADANPIEALKEALSTEFNKFGTVTEVQIVPNKNIAFITFESRVFAEFAKVAMASQPLDKYSTALNVKWAQDMKKDFKKKGYNKAQFQQLVQQHESQLQKFQQQFLQNNQFLNPPQISEDPHKKAQENIQKMQHILSNTENIDDDKFNVDI